MKNNIKALRLRAQMTQAQLAEATGVGVPQVSKWESGRVDIPASRLYDIAFALKASPDQLLNDQFAYSNQSWTIYTAENAPGGVLPVENEQQRQADIQHRAKLKSLKDTVPVPQADDEPEPNAVVVPMEGASTERMQPNLPIYGTALGAPRQIDGEAIEQVTLNRGEVLEYVRRPVLLNGNALAYGLRVEGYSMEPRHRDGEMLIVDPSGRVRIGDDVVVYLRPPTPEEDDGETARAVLVKRIVRRSSGYVELEQYQPARTFRIDMSDVLRIDRVVPWQELLG